MTARAAARKRPGFRPESESSEPREQDRDSSRTNFCVSERVVGVGRGFGIHLINVSMSNVWRKEGMFRDATSFNQPLHAPWYYEESEDEYDWTDSESE